MTRQPTPEHQPDDWRARAACRDKNAQLFTDPRPATDDVRSALTTCTTCSVRAACLTAALRHSADADVGIWGGTTEQTRRQIRAGHLTTEQALNPDQHRNQEPSKRRINGSVQGPQTGSKVAHARPVPRQPADELAVALDERGDYVSADGRVLIFRIHGERPWALAIDDRFITTSLTATEARRIAWSTLHHGRLASMSEAEARQVVAPVQPPRRR